MRHRPPTKKWWRGYNALYGKIEPVQEELALDGVESKGCALSLNSDKKLAVKADCLTEQEEQFIAHAWLTRLGIIHHHSPNGGYRDVREAAKFKRMGVSPGFPDFVFFYARSGYHGLAIELKRVSGGKLSEHQLWWRDFLIKEGYAWYEAKGADECVSIACDYMGIEKR